MASFISLYMYVLRADGGTRYTITDAFPNTVDASDGDADRSFDAGDVITAPTLTPEGLYYQGWYLDGWLGVTQDGSRIYYMSNEILPRSFSFNANRDAFIACFLAGTLIATPTGDRPVETLAVGDPVLTAGGRTVPVRWVGRRTVVTAFGPGPKQAPMEIAAGALGSGLPARPLRLTADHALLVDGLLVQAAALVGTAARRLTAAELGERYTVVYHVETEAHDLIVAEGVAAETFLNNVTRRRFDNYAEFEGLYGETGSVIGEMDVPRVKSARQLPQAIRRRLDERVVGTMGTGTDAAA